MQIENIIIRTAIEPDFDIIVELWREMMDFHAQLDPIFIRASDGPKKFKEYLHKILKNKDKSFLLVAELLDEKQIVGYCLGNIDNYPPVFQIKHYGAIYDMAVTATYRRMHIGEKMFIKARDWCIQKGLKRIELRVAVLNEISPKFWIKMGFKPYLKSMFLPL